MQRFSRRYHQINRASLSRCRAIPGVCTDTAGQEGPLQALRSSDLPAAVRTGGPIPFSLRCTARSVLLFTADFRQVVHQRMVFTETLHFLAGVFTQIST